MSNYVHFTVWDEITYPFPNFNDGTMAYAVQYITH